MRRLRHAAALRVEKAGVGNYPHVDMADVESGGRGHWNARSVENRGTEGLMAHAGDVVIGKLRPYLRKGFCADRTITCSTEFLVLTPSSDWSPRFLMYLLLGRTFTGFAEATVEGTRMPRTSWESVRNFRMPMLPHSDQLAVAEVLDRECARIRELAKELEEGIRLNRDWLRSRAVERIGVGASAQMPFGRYATLQRGFDLPDRSRRKGHIPVVGSGGPVGVHDIAMTSGPSVVTGRYGSIGHVYWSPAPCWPLNTTLFISDFKGSNPRFVYWALRALPLEQEAAKAAVPGLHRADIHRLRLGRHSLEEQCAVAETLDAHAAEVEQLRDVFERQLKDLDEYHDALITEGTSGELDISHLSESQMDESLAAVREGTKSEVLT